MRKIAILATIILFSIVSFSCSNSNKHAPIPVLIVTDFGKDIDDALAIAHIAHSKELDAVMIIHNGNPSEEASEKLTQFLKINHIAPPLITVKSHDETDMTAEETELIYSLFKKYGNRLNIAILSQPTVITNLLYSDHLYSNHLNKPDISGLNIFIQAYPTLSEGGNLLADDASYNTRLDMASTQKLYDLGDKIIFTFVGKYAAYEYRLTAEDILTLTPNREVNNILAEEALKGVEEFARRDSATYYRVYGVDSSIPLDEALSHQKYLSNPYDLLTVKAIDNPEFFKFRTIGRHRVTGDQ